MKSAIMKSMFSNVPIVGAALWHPRCGPGPGESGLVINGFGGPPETSSIAGDNFDGLSSTMSELHYGGMGSRASSPGGSMMRDYRSQSPGYPHYMHSYLRQGRLAFCSLLKKINVSLNNFPKICFKPP